MKIVCDNCSAKYSIADEKVAGKVFKIRCKKCTNVIVVRGDQVAAAEEEEAATQVFDYGSDQVWHVVVDGDQQGPFAPIQLGVMITEGTIDWEAYVWKEGFDGWKPARDVPELVTAISGDQPADAGGAAAGAAAGGMGDDPFGGGGDPFAGGDEDAFAGGGAAADPGADLFAGGGEAASPFGGDDDAGADDDVVASPSPRVSQEQAMTGARNENSVLFSLSNLQALATGGPSDGGGAAAPAPMASSGPAPGHASGEGSGLIDIRALASATAATGGGGGGGLGGGGGGGGADDLLSIGGSGGLGSSLGAPVLAPAAPEPEEGNKKMMLILGGVGILVVGLLVALIVVLTREPAPVAQAGAPGANTAGPGTPEMPATAAADPNGTNPATMNAGQPVTGTMAEEADDEGDDEGDEADEGDEDEGSTSSGRRSRRARRGSRGGSSGGSSGGSAMSDPEPATMTRNTAMGSIDDLLDQAIGGGGSMSAMASAMASNLPPQPSRDDVGRALRGVSGRVAGCGNGTSGVANAAISFASSGRVRSVRVTGVPPAVQSCVSRGVRSARVPAFSRDSFSVNFPFRVR